MTLRKEKKSNENKNFETNFFFLNRQLFFCFSQIGSPLWRQKKRRILVTLKRVESNTKPPRKQQSRESRVNVYIVREIEESTMRFVSLNSIEF